MKLKALPYDLTVCKLRSLSDLPQGSGFFFLGKTDEEISLVCETRLTPNDTIAKESGWKAFRIQGELDFSLIGILSKISAILAEEKIGIFAISTYNTDTILLKSENFEKGLKALAEKGYEIE